MSDTKWVNRTTPEVYAAPRASEQLGRFPANLVLSHSEGCRPIGTKKVKAAGGDIKDVPGTARNSMGEMPEARSWQAHGNGDGTETVEAWECADDCAVRMLDEQSGITKSPSRIVTQGGRKGGGFDVGSGGRTRKGKFQGHGDSGGASRFFYCAKASRSDRNSGVKNGK